jgi:hypothetical protein
MNVPRGLAGRRPLRWSALVEAQLPRGAGADPDRAAPADGHLLVADVTGVGDQDGVVTQLMDGEVSELGVDMAWLGRQGVVAGPDAAGAAELEEVRVQDIL